MNESNKNKAKITLVQRKLENALWKMKNTDPCFSEQAYYLYLFHFECGSFSFFWNIGHEIL